MTPVDGARIAVERGGDRPADAAAIPVGIGETVPIDMRGLQARDQDSRRPIGIRADGRAGVSDDAVEGFVAVYSVAEDGPDTTAHLLRLVRRVPMGGKQVHDANIAATMLAHGITRLLTFNAADFRRFEGLIEVVMP